MQTFNRAVLGVVLALVAAIAVVLAAGDHSGIGIRAVSPSDSSHPSSTVSLQVEFAESMKPSSVEERFSLEPAVVGKVLWEGTTFVFIPTSAFETGRIYTATIQAGAVSESGRILQNDLVWSFRPRMPSILYLTSMGDSAPALWSIDPVTKETREIYAAEYGVYDFAISRDGEQIAVTILNEDGTSVIRLMDVSGQNQKSLPSCEPGSCSGPAWSPDGKLIAYEKQGSFLTGSPGPNRIWLYELASGATSPLFEDEQILGFAPRWSRDGTQLAFFDANSEAIRILDMTTGLMTLVPNQTGEVGSFAPDDLHMVYTDIRLVGRTFFPELWLADLGDPLSIQPLLASSEEDQSPSWSPDGRWIAFTRRHLDRSDGWGRQLMLLDAVTLEMYPLTDDNQYNNTAFVWSPSGQQILVQRFDLQSANSNPELWIIDIRSDTKTLLLENAFQGEWMP